MRPFERDESAWERDESAWERDESAWERDESACGSRAVQAGRGLGFRLLSLCLSLFGLAMRSSLLADLLPKGCGRFHSKVI